MENVFMNNYYHLSPEERALIMIEYNQGAFNCKLDTLAMVKILNALKSTLN